MFPIWKFCRDVISGNDAVKKARTEYLPKPDGMGESEYNAFLMRGEFFPATGRTLEGIHGMIRSKPMIKNIPEQYKDMLSNVDGEGNSIDQFTDDVVWDCLQTSFGGVFVDMPDGEGLSQRQAEENGVEPYISYYKAEQIINWELADKGKNKRFNYVILEEKKETPTLSKYIKETKLFYRVLELDEEGFYKHTLYDEHENVIYSTYPKKNGERLMEIPFWFLPNSKPYKPMMKDIADVNIAWWRKSADLENALHWLGIPTPYAIGYEPEIRYDEEGNEVPAQKLRLGGPHIIYFPQGVTHVGFLELNGNGLNHLKSAMADDEDRMAILGARIISQERKGVEAAETARIHRAGENSVIAAFANEVSLPISKALKFYLEWLTDSEITEPVEVHLNTDYDLSRMTPAELTALVSLWQSGGVSKKILFTNLQQGEVIPPSETFENMEADIQEEREQNDVLITNMEKQNEM